MKVYRFLVLFCLVAGLAATPNTARAQDYPARPVRLIIGSAPGGMTDVLGRVAAEYFGRAHGQMMVADNRPGAGGNIATGLLAKAAADGYTVLICEVGQITANPWLYKDFPIHPMTDIIPVATFADGPLIAFVNAKLPITSIKELVEYTKKNPEQMSYGSVGIGTSMHLAVDQFNRMTGIDMVHVPYRGSGLAVADLAAGRVQVVFMGIASAAGQVKAGQIRPLAVSNATRIKAVPDVPTFAEAGLPQYGQSNWYAFFVPQGTPASIVLLLNRSVNRILEEPALLERFESQGLLPRKTTPEEFLAQFRADYVKWRDIVRAAGIAVQ
jgi:tripartite-type tricarboxylate transporter receptor subunit TctC